MPVASHLGIRLDEYDARIRTFIPDYDQMLTAAAQALTGLGATAPHIVDMGTGTGALAAACLRALPAARVTVVDEDPGILDVARQRLQEHGNRVAALCGSFVDLPFPTCDAVVGSLTFHHLRTFEIKGRVYRRFRDALNARGMFVSVDCCPSEDSGLATDERTAWRAHLRLHYSETETDAYFATWARDDMYVTLASELALVREAGFAPEVVWRRGTFAVIAATRV